MKQATLTFLIIVCAQLFFGQSNNHLTQRLIDEAKLTMSAGAHLDVYEILEPFYKVHPSNMEVAHLFAANAWKLPLHKSKALPVLAGLYSSRYYPSYPLYAQVLLAHGKPNKALEILQTPELNDSLLDPMLVRHAANAVEAMSNSIEHEITRLSDEINSQYAEHTPLISADAHKIYFTSRRPLHPNSVADFEGQFDENIFESREVDHRWKEAEALRGNINQPLNEATSAISMDGNKMLVFRTSHDLTEANIWLAEKDEALWRWTSKLAKSINSTSIEQGATWNLDQNVFYFSSNRPGGYGGFDLYRVVKFADGEYSEPQNLGSQINTEYDEISPCLLPDDKTLFFSSNNRLSIGGFDFFKSLNLGDTNWTLPENIGYPINSTMDDLQMSLTWEAGVAYFSRPKKENIGDLDIYKTKLPGYNVNANVFKVKIADFDINLEYEITLWSHDLTEALGYYLPTTLGEFVVVLLPGESGILKISATSLLSVELKLEYQQTDGVLIRNEEIILNPRTE